MHLAHVSGLPLPDSDTVTFTAAEQQSTPSSFGVSTVLVCILLAVVRFFLAAEFPLWPDCKYSALRENSPVD